MNKPVLEVKYSFLKIIYEFLKSPLLGHSFKILRIYFSKYVTVSYRKTPAVNITLSIDNLIPQRPLVKDYLNIFYFPVTLIARAHIGRYLDPEIEAKLYKSTSTLINLYEKTCSVYELCQSRFHRNSANSISIKLLRIFDRNKNCYPSLHAQVIAELYNTFFGHEKIIKDQELLDKTSQILEACFLVKQHSIQDIAAGLAGVTVLDPSFTDERAKEIIYNIFKNRKYDMKDELCDTIRNIMVDIYDKVLTDSKNKSYEETFVNHLLNKS